MNWDTEKEGVIDPSRPGQTQPDRQKVMDAACLRQGQRSPRVTLFMLRFWQHPLNQLAFSRSHTRTHRSTHIHCRWEDPQRVGGCLLRLIGSLESTKVSNQLSRQSVSVCCISAHRNVCACVCVSSGHSMYLLKEIQGWRGTQRLQSPFDVFFTFYQ